MSNVDIPKSIFKTPPKRVSTVALHWFLCNSATKSATGKASEHGNYVFCPVSRRWRRIPAVESRSAALRQSRPGELEPHSGTAAVLPLKGPARHSYRPRGCRACVAQIHRGAAERPFTPLPHRRAEHPYRSCPGTPGLGSPPGSARAARRGWSRR